MLSPDCLSILGAYYRRLEPNADVDKNNKNKQMNIEMN